MRRMKTLLRTLLLLLSVLAAVTPTQSLVPAKSRSAGPASADEEFIIKKPGEITFTSGIVIEGRVEKPQVMLVLTKERIKVEPVLFQQSFLKNITDPLRYNTFQISKGSTEEMGGTDNKKMKRN